ncbi:orotidine-5'-phosphate decarboxylase [Rhodococcus sp. IEGM 1401]|uniref:orotidine-5'-phosphate decarboxylase n=1 Tax=unclassified Rhodococcus (in: high G+C Gram-positive bacteria) TaxID=192944 RepID=UPI0022B46331|nr:MULTISPECIES: orotidine-5'-phosphate decarboxylase [unclassified Rhodococcus (in: high G+C Gram-positive bacteria)]MCZ4560398.1 orotidine-5'-phosphate decarboxylase [Rhodococcus sp. IEGM 1401]MDI9920525.1 orotidine-5'-phosphate decarboxylase [Rhodococcus sp. IEGM 1372]MDI9924674.1 orotidine-5'-phosphate decarboxylase [Rhodococcus sp. IEGM 1341]MDV8032789.1 orotidine-5'-phosphate decarboxylase [Rhodococcus sp. IEGM 1414]MDV8056986.1 orotidine-5'-phosphate decarboxylase [Rhodococcus sp. IEGM 
MSHHTWSDRLRAAVAARGRLCVGIDPHPALLAAWDLPRSADGLEVFAELCVEAYVGEVAIVKPQVAFFEAYGSAGYAVLERTVSVLRDAGTLVISDAKRGDIGTTMDAYAQAWLEPDSPLSSDAVTVSPYLGFDSLGDTVDRAVRHRRGLFVLARTSNAEGSALQQAATSDGESVAQSIVDAAGKRNRVDADTVGLVVGATRDHGLDLSNYTGPILAPGLGAQGATVADLAEIFRDSRELLLPNSSRGVLAAGPSVTALRDAATRLRDEIEAGLA